MTKSHELFKVVHVIERNREDVQYWCCAKFNVNFMCYASRKVQPKYCPYCGGKLEEEE